MSDCKTCPARIALAKLFDVHVDKLDCPYECEEVNGGKKD